MRCPKIQQSLSLQTLSTMMQLSQSDVAVHFCTFQAYLERAKVNLRFPSLFFVEWKSINGKNAVSMVGRKRAINSLVELNETLIFTTEMLFHRAQRQYLKKESLIHLNLISNSRPDQIKLVGRVVVDLSEIANTHRYSTVSTAKLMYCSVDAEISFSMKLTRSIDSNLQLNELDRSSFSDLYSFTTSLKNTPRIKERKESMSEKKADEERKKIKSRFTEREDNAIEMQKNIIRQAKIQNILIKDIHQQANQERSLPNSLPLTEKKPPLSLDAQLPIQPARPVITVQPPKPIIISQFDTTIQRQRDSLEKQLNQHKNRIKKLESDIKQVLRLFEQSQQNSQINKSKLIQSQQMINSLRETQTKVKQYYERQITIIKQANTKQLDLLRSGYEADIKILQATIEQQRLKTSQQQQNNHKIIQQYQAILKQNEDLKAVLKDQQQKFSKELTQIKSQNMNFHSAKESILASIDQKQSQLNKLQQENNRLKQQIQSLTKKQGNLAQQLKNEVVAKNKEVETLKAQINTTINQISNDLKSKSTQLFEYKQEAQAKLEQTIFQYQHKLLQSAQQLEKLKAENAKLLEELNNNPKQATLNYQINPNDTVSLENYQKLRQQHNKLTKMLQTLKKSIIFPEEQLRLYQLAQNNKPDLFVIMERSQLQEIQISELKQENATMRQKMGQLVEEHEQLKNSRNKEESHAKPVIDQLQLQELNLIKEQLANSKDSQAALLENQRKLQEQINSLKEQLVSTRAQRDGLKQENQRSALQISHLKGEKPMRLVSFNSSEGDMGIILNPQEAIKIQGQRSNINIQLKQKPQSETVRLNIEIGRLQSLEDANYEAPIEHERPDFMFDEHLTHEQVNKISELHVNHDDEINYLRTENNKLKEEIEELKFIKQSLAQNAIEQPNNSLKMLELQNKLKQTQQQNQSLKSAMPIANGPTQQPQLSEEMSNKLLILEEELQQSKRIIAQLQSQLTELNRKNEGQGQAITGHQQKQNTHIKQLEAKLINLQQELKIKDEILIDGERTIEQNYAIKYELAELKEKYSEIKSALDERDEMINQLQETKQQLSKQLEQVVDKSRQSAFHIQLKDVKQEFISTPTFEVQQQTHKQLNGEVQALKKELISLNNSNIELRSQLQEFANQKLAMERINQQNINKLLQLQEQKRQLQTQVNDLSLLINAPTQQPDKLSIAEQKEIQKVEAEMKKLSDEVHQLRANYSNLVGQSGIKQEKIAMLQRLNQQARQKIEELTIMMQKIKQQQDHQFIKDLPQVRIHEVESFNEAPSLEYEHSVIPLQDQSTLKASEHGPILPPPDFQQLHAVIESLQEKIDKLTNQLNKQASQKDIYYNNLQVSNNKILDLQAQVVTMKEQIDKLNSLPIQSFAVSSAKNKHQYQTFSKNMRETSIMYQPRVRGEASMSQASTPQKNNFQKGEYSKDVQTRVQTNVQTKVIKESDAELLQQELDMLKEQLESQAKLHHELREIHGMCEKKYELLNNHHENCLQQLELFKNQNEGLVKEKQNMAQQLYLLKEELQRMQAQQEQINTQYAKFLKSNQNAEPNNVPLQNQEATLQQSMGPKLFLQFKHSMEEMSQFTKRQQEFLASCQKYQKTIADLKINEQKLIKKINLLEDNMFSMQKALQQQIQINQANDKITQKLEQLNELQSMASHFQKELGNDKAIKQQLEILKEQNCLLIRQKEQLMKALQEHALCLQERTEWQQKLQNIEHMLMNNESKFAEQKQELENKVLLLNEEKAYLQAQRTIIHENIKKGSQIMIIDNPTQQKENGLYAELQAVRNEKLSQMQKVVDLEAKLNQETEQKVKKVAQLQKALISKDHQIQQSKFVNIQLLREIEEIKVQYAERDLQENKKKSEILRITQQNTTITQDITKLREKLQQTLSILHQKDLQIKNLQQQIAFLSSNTSNNEQLANISEQITSLREEITQKISSIEALEGKIKEYQSQMNNIKSQLLGKVESLRLCELKLQVAEEGIQRVTNENAQLLKIRAQLQKQVKILNGRYSELEKAVKNTATSKDKNTQLLKGEISKRDQQISELSKKIKSKQADIISLNKQLDNWKVSSQKNELKIQQLAQKQKLMKETMQIIEQEAQKVVQSLKSRYESQEVYYKKFIQKERENSRLNLALTSAKEEIANKERSLLFEQQKLSKLQSHIELLRKSSQGEQISSKIVTIQYEKYEKLMQKNDQLMNKNRQYLQIISQKTTASLESERLKNEIRQFQQKLDQHQQTSVMAQQIIQNKLPRLEKELELANNQKQQLIQIINSLKKDIQVAKQQNMHNSHKSIQNLLQEKDKQINLLKQSVTKKGKQPEQAPSLIEEHADSSISILNQQILNLNRQILEKDNQLQRIKADMRKNKSLVVGAQVAIASSVMDEEKQKLINEIQQRERRQQQYKESIDRLKQQLKKEKSSSSSPQKPNRDTHGNNIENIQVISHDLHNLCEQIKTLCQKRSSSDESDKLFQTFVQKYDLMEEQFNNLNAETSVIQQKAKFISKQLQKVKSFIIKGQNRAFKEKTQLLALIKPCEIAASELVNISQTLSEKQSQNFI